MCQTREKISSTTTDSTITASTTDVTNAYNDFVVPDTRVHGSTHPNCQGVSMYYPLKVQSQAELNTFKQVCPIPEYYQTIKSLVSKKNSGVVASAYQVNTVKGKEKSASGYHVSNLILASTSTASSLRASNAAIQDDDEINFSVFNTNDGEFAYLDLNNNNLSARSLGLNVGNYLTLTFGNVDSVRYVSGSLYMQVGGDEEYYLGTTDDVDYSDDRLTVMDGFDGYWPSIKASDSSTIYLPLEVSSINYSDDNTNDVTAYTCAAKIDGNDAVLLISKYTSGDAITWEITGQTKKTVAGSVAARTNPVKDGSVISVVYNHTTDGWNSFDEATSASFTYNAASAGSLIDYQKLNGGDNYTYHYSFVVSDLFGNEYYTDEANLNIDDDDNTIYISLLTVPEVVTAPAMAAVTSLTYDGNSHQVLSVAGTASGGTIQYQAAARVNGSSELTDNWIPTASAVTVKDVGVYDIYYMILGDEEHYDTRAVKIGTFTINAVSRSSDSGSGSSTVTTTTVKDVTAADLSSLASGSLYTVNISNANSASLSKATLQNLAESKAGGLEMKFAGGLTAALDKNALSAIAGQMTNTDLKVSVSKNASMNAAQKNAAANMKGAIALDITITSNGKNISSFNGGSGTLSLQAEAGKNYKAWYIDANGNKESCEVKVDKETGIASITIKHASLYVLEETNSFLDVDSTDYFADAVDWAVAQGITKGSNATHFSPNSPATRAQLVTFLYRAAKETAVTTASTFTDLESGSYYEEAVLWAAAKGYVKGIDAAHFAPDKVVTRGEVVTILARMSGEDLTSFTNAFSDIAASDYCSSAAAWAAAKGIAAGVGNNRFAPADSCTRAQIVTFLYRDFAK